MTYSPKSYTVPEATKKLERYCAYQERCHLEVVNKLRTMRMIPEAVDHITAHLIQHDFLNEERFSRSYARGKFNVKNWGKGRIVAELLRRNISKYNIKLALEEIPEKDYLQKLDLIAKKRLSQIKERNIQKKKKKLADYLLYRGWEKHLIYQKISDLIN
ncbi:regulatory protein RecX [uncultured Eudoraea sp.]|uniref:regulatory protein RecX n=1 Tax=uncultured Eudoraea sp. TaxID=1035614 RepID=UPI0026348DE2|nr:regulatory protein RecX [uncultured Eudoraea sp.]